MAFHCLELLSKNARDNAALRKERAGAADFGRFHRLHADGRTLIRRWVHRAEQSAVVTNGDKGSFEAFIFAWISFNGWAACVSDHDRDQVWMDVLLQNPSLEHAFANALHEPRFTEAANVFHNLWPIFEVRELRQSGVPRHHSGNRRRIVTEYLNAGLTRFHPACWTGHGNAPDSTPLDWAHTLAALYRVRCNLFHGEKSLDSENDRAVTTAAVGILMPLIRDICFAL